MARTVDPARHAQRRLGIIDAALTRFSVDGYERTTTASICREAGIGSGTFFHYFPTKADVLVAILDVGTAETRTWFAEQEGRNDPLVVLEDWLDHTVADLGDQRLAGFVRAVSAVMTQPRIAAALAADEGATRDGLSAWVHRGQQAGQVRADVDADRLAAWVALIVDGFVGRVATDSDFVPRREADLLRETVAHLLRC